MSSTTSPWVARRIRLLAWSALPMLLMLLVALKLLSLPLLTSGANDAHGAGDGAGVRTAGERLGIVNVVQRWRAPYVKGTGQSMSGDLDGGRATLERALRATSKPSDDCVVRTNLVLTIAAQSDKAGEDGDTDLEKKRAEEALALIEEGPEGCLEGSNDGSGGEAGQKQKEAKERLEEKTKGDEGDDGDKDKDPKDKDKKKDEPSEEEKQEKEQKKKDLKERNKSAQGDAENDKKSQEAQDNHDGDYAEKPW